MKREEEERKEETKEEIILLTKCPETKNLPDELSLNYSEKNPVRRIICSKVQNLTGAFNYLPDSNSNFRPARINFGAHNIPELQR